MNIKTTIILGVLAPALVVLHAHAQTLQPGDVVIPVADRHENKALRIGPASLVLSAHPMVWQSGNIGIAITTKNENQPLRVGVVFPGSPAERAGIETNWFLISVNGTNVLSMPSAQCMNMIHGPVGTSVTLDLADSAMSRTNGFTVTRADVKMPEDLFHQLFGSPTSNAPPNNLPPHAVKSFLLAR